MITKYSRKHYSDVKQHMAEKGPPAPTPKPVRKPATQVKVKEPSQKNLPKQNPSKAAPPLEPRIVVVLVQQQCLTTACKFPYTHIWQHT